MIKKQIVTLLLTVVGMTVIIAPTAQAVECSILPDFICGSADNGDLESSSIWKLLLFVLRLLTTGIGVTAVGALGYFSFLYATAGDNSGQTKEAKEKIRNTVVGIILYGAMYLLLEFLIPGGVFA